MDETGRDGQDEGARALLRLLTGGPRGRRELDRTLGWSQPTFSRRVRALEREVLAVGRGPATRYAARRRIEGVGDRVALYELDEAGGARHAATLSPVYPRGYWVEAHTDDLDSGFFEDLPWFLFDLRPAGFLGRFLPKRHPEMPRDVTLWTGDHVMSWLVRHGGDEVGAFVLGEAALERARQRDRLDPPWTAGERAERFPRLAELALAEPVGSSAAGEQPKFLVRRVLERPRGARSRREVEPEVRDALVKFSPVRARGDVVAQRVADLLVAEHLTHEVLCGLGRAACSSQLLEAGGRVFLEVERFDRTALGRRGVVSFFAFDGEFVGRLHSWLDTARGLERLRRVDPGLVTEVAWRGFFGRCLANSDMHHGNLAFMTRGVRVLGLAPSYDMLPMSFMPRQGNLVTPAFLAPVPLADEVAVADSAREAAVTVWHAVSQHALVSKGFRKVAGEIAAQLG